MFHGFFLGVIGGAVAAKLFGRHRHGGCGGGHGGCGHGFGGPGWRGYGRWRGGPGFFPRFGLFGLVRELDLTPEQWHQGQEILRNLHASLHQGRDELRGSVGPLLSILAAAEFDPARAEELAKRHDAAFGQVRTDVLAALGRLHALLTPAQRERLRRFVAETNR